MLNVGEVRGLELRTVGVNHARTRKYAGGNTTNLRNQSAVSTCAVLFVLNAPVVFCAQT